MTTVVIVNEAHKPPIPEDINPVINDEQDNLQAADDYRSVLSVITLKFHVINAKTHVDVKIRSNEVLFETTSI